MKKWIHGSIKTNSQSELPGSSPDNRLEIDFYGVDPEIVIESVSNSKKVFKNTEVVMRDMSAFLKGLGLTVLDKHKSSNYDSDSTYYDIDVKVKNPKGKLAYVYFRISDHTESYQNSDARDDYHARITRNYANLPEDADVTGTWYYESIEVVGKKYNNYDRAMNYAKQRILAVLKEKGIVEQ